MQPDTRTALAEVQQTRDYGQFKILEQNRQISRSHVAALARSIADNPEILKYRPVLVNENMEIIDGQHRFEVAQQLEMPVYYMVGTGLEIGDTRRMNSVQRSWTPMDYARSFAAAGNRNYIEYLRYRLEYNAPHYPTMAYMVGVHSSHRGDAFRQGRFVSDDTDENIKWRFEQLEEASAVAPEHGARSAFAMALLNLIKHPDYKAGPWLSALKKYGPKYLRNYSSQIDYTRSFEMIYNEDIPRLQDQIQLITEAS